MRKGVGWAGSYVNVSAGSPLGGSVSSTPSPRLVLAWPREVRYQFVSTCRASGHDASCRHRLSPMTKRSTGGSRSTPLSLPESQ
ncbi:MAG TPA: hypothetical protein VJR24_02525 [Gemmatimonadaceae bacterium]|nr:hypothetical protein [Gemmatimonadaceae bacterium]